MARVKRGVTARARHRKVLAEAKGYYGARRKIYRTAKQAVIKAGQYAYRDRRQRKREFRARAVSLGVPVYDEMANAGHALAALQAHERYVKSRSAK